jgi:GNAT superfamily N-acetyltransferase
MKIFEITEEVLTIRPMQMGMSSMQNDEVVMAGGMRSGNSRAGYTRLKYMIYDLRGAEGQLQPEDWDKREAGFVELFIKDGSGEMKPTDIEGLVNIEIKPAMRKTGIGSVVIQSLKDTAGELRIYDIKPKAVAFWRKVGATFYVDSHFQQVAKKTTGVRTGLYAII